MSEEQEKYNAAGFAVKPHIIMIDDVLIEFKGKVVARLGRKRIVIFARDAAEIWRDGRVIYKKLDGKWYWEIKP